MGEAVYYLKARCDNPAKAEELTKEFNALLIQLEGAYDYWQSNRAGDQAVFWFDFKSQYPLVLPLISSLVDGDCNNALAGSLSYTGYDEDRAECHEDIIFYCANVWHFADWDPLRDWLLERGAIACEWISDEYIDPFDVIGV